MGIGKLSSHWKVNETAIYEPSAEPKILHSSITSADTGRTEDGYMHIGWVVPDIVKITVTWKALTGLEVKQLVTLMQGKEFTLTYVEFGEEKTADVYVSEINYTPKSNSLFSSEGGLCTDITISMIEK